MRFYSQQDLFNHWEGGRSYREQSENGEVTVVSDTSRDIPFLARKFYQIKELYDAMKNKVHAHHDIKLKLGAMMPDRTVIADARYKIYYKGGRFEEHHAAFLYPFIDDCISLWENPLK